MPDLIPPAIRGDSVPAPGRRTAIEAAGLSKRFGDVLYELALMAGLTVVYFAIAVAVFGRTQWRRE